MTTLRKALSIICFAIACIALAIAHTFIDTKIGLTVVSLVSYLVSELIAQLLWIRLFDRK